MAESLTDRSSSVRFICKICGMRAPEPVLCVKDACPTETLVLDVSSVRKH